MQRCSWVAFVLAGCGFAAPDASGLGDAGPDGGSWDGADAPLQPTPDAARACSAPDPALVACYELDGDIMDSTAGAHHGVAISVRYEAGRSGSAVVLTAESHITIASSPALLPRALTIEAWVRLDAQPAGESRMGIIDHDAAYGFFIHPGSLLCANQQVPATLTVGRWTHLACTHDGATATIFVDGVAIGSRPGAALGNGNAAGVALGGNAPTGSTLIGALDQVRLWNVARSPAQVCEAAGQPTCP